MVVDVSKKTVMVLLLLTIVVSAMGTWIALESINQGTVITQKDYGAAQVKIGVNVPPQNFDGPKFDSTTGKVSLYIQPSK